MKWPTERLPSTGGSDCVPDGELVRCRFKLRSSLLPWSVFIFRCQALCRYIPLDNGCLSTNLIINTTPFWIPLPTAVFYSTIQQCSPILHLKCLGPYKFWKDVCELTLDILCSFTFERGIIMLIWNDLTVWYRESASLECCRLESTWKWDHISLFLRCDFLTTISFIFSEVQKEFFIKRM